MQGTDDMRHLQDDKRSARGGAIRVILAPLVGLAIACGSADGANQEADPFGAPYCQELLDDERDGSVDAIISATFEDGLLTRREFDHPVGGNIEAVETSSYDQDRNQVELAVDYDLDGRADFIERWTYDDQGNETSYRRDAENDGNFEHREEHVYANDGTIARTDSYGSRGGGAELTGIAVYTVDELGRPTHIDLQDPTGGLLAFRDFSYLADRLIHENLTSVRLRENRLEEETFYEHDARGRLTSAERHTADGLDQTLYQWDDLDRVITIDSLGPSLHRQATRTYDCL